MCPPLAMTVFNAHLVLFGVTRALGVLTVSPMPPFSPTPLPPPLPTAGLGEAATYAWATLSVFPEALGAGFPRSLVSSYRRSSDTMALRALSALMSPTLPCGHTLSFSTGNTP